MNQSESAIALWPTAWPWLGCEGSGEGTNTLIESTSRLLTAQTTGNNLSSETFCNPLEYYGPSRNASSMGSSSHGGDIKDMNQLSLPTSLYSVPVSGSL